MPTLPSLLDLAWLVAGMTIAWFVMRARRPRPTSTSVVTRAPGGHTAGAATPTPRPVAGVESHSLALSLAEELANLVSGVEGRAHHLIEAAPDRAQLPGAAEALLTAVSRLRLLHSKLRAFGQGRVVAIGSTNSEAIVHSLGQELGQMQLGLQLRAELPKHLPQLAVHHDVARDTMLFLCAAMLRAERGATNLSVAGELCFAKDEPRVQLQLALEWDADPTSTTTELLDDPAFTLDLEAANNLAIDHGGELTIFHLPGRSVRAIISWPALLNEPAADPAEPLVEPSSAAFGDQPRSVTSHDYGGAIVLETDPAIRAVLASELKATGRAVFACADAAAACTLLAATPNRFELLIVDHPQRLEEGHGLAQAIRNLAPDLKIFMLSQNSTTPRPAFSQLHFLPKPFGVHELRRALASVLAAG